MIAKINYTKSIVYEVSGTHCEMVARLPSLKLARKIAKLYSKGLIPPVDEFATQQNVNPVLLHKRDIQLRKYLALDEIDAYYENIYTVNWQSKDYGTYKNGKKVLGGKQNGLD